MIDDGVLVDKDLGHRIGEIGLPLHPDVALDDARLAVSTGDDQRPRVRHHRGHLGSRHEDDVDGAIQDRSLGDVDEGPVLHERGVQCREASAAEVGELAEIPLDDVGVVDQRGGE